MTVNLSHRLVKLEARTQVPSPVTVWIEDMDQPGEIINQTTGERRPLDDAPRLGAGDILVRYVDDGSGEHDAGE